MDTYISAFPWDLTDEGVDVVLDRLRGELGASGLVVWLAAPATQVLRTGNIDPRMVRHDGGLYFHSQEQSYHGTRLKPIPAASARGRCQITAAAQGCHERGLALRLIVSASRTGTLARRHEELACKNLWGIKSPSTICLSNPDVQTFLVGLLRETRERFPSASIELRDWHITARDVFQESWQTSRDLSEAEKEMLSICFCESCFQQAESAGVDVESARRHVQALLDHSLSQTGAPQHRRESLFLESPPLGAYLAAQAQVLRNLLRRLAENSRSALIVDQANLTPLTAMCDDDLPESAAPLLTLLSGELLRSKYLHSTNKKRHLRWPVQTVVTGGQELVAQLAQAAETGVASAEIESYGWFTESIWTVLKQALRFSRRRLGGE